MVSTLDFESSDPSSNLGRTLFFGLKFYCRKENTKHIKVQIWKFPLQRKVLCHQICLKIPMGILTMLLYLVVVFFFVFKAYSELWEMFENYIAGCDDGLFIISPAPPLL